MKYSKILHKYDEDGCYEFPSDFDYYEFEKKAKFVWKRLQKALNKKFVFEDGSYCQDSSFGSAIILAEEEDKQKNVIYRSAIRFSNFGNLVTITDPTMISKDAVDKIISILADNGYTYIPPEVLNNEYDGIMKNQYDFGTWWIRYFDWL